LPPLSSHLVRFFKGSRPPKIVKEVVLLPFGYFKNPDFVKGPLTPRESGGCRARAATENVGFVFTVVPVGRGRGIELGSAGIDDETESHVALLVGRRWGHQKVFFGWRGGRPHLLVFK
jgi:hypothetical protein